MPVRRADDPIATKVIIGLNVVAFVASVIYSANLRGVEAWYVFADDTASVAAGAQRQFSVGGQWSDGSAAAPAVSDAATGGTVNTNGRFSDGTAAVPFRNEGLELRRVLSRTSTVTVTVTPPVDRKSVV